MDSPRNCRPGRAPGARCSTRRCRAVPHAVRLQHVSRSSTRMLNGRPRLLDVAAHLLEDDCATTATTWTPRARIQRTFCQFTELAAAVRSPGAPMKREQHRSREEGARATACPPLGRQLERRSAGERGCMRHDSVARKHDLDDLPLRRCPSGPGSRCSRRPATCS